MDDQHWTSGGIQPPHSPASPPAASRTAAPLQSSIARRPTECRAPWLPSSGKMYIKEVARCRSEPAGASKTDKQTNDSYHCHALPALCLGLQCIPTSNCKRAAHACSLPPPTRHVLIQSTTKSRTKAECLSAPEHRQQASTKTDTLTHTSFLPPSLPPLSLSLHTLDALAEQEDPGWRTGTSRLLHMYVRALTRGSRSRLAHHITSQHSTPPERERVALRASR